MGLKIIKVCIVYDLNGEIIYYYFVSLKELEVCKFIYEEFFGWDEDIIGVKIFEELLINVQNYLCKLEEFVGVKIVIFFVGFDCE